MGNTNALIHGFARHDGSRSNTYGIWHSMRNRCFNKNSKDYHRYGARGINICKRWNNYVNFLNDMGECPPDYSLDRIDNNKGYCKTNCKWSTALEQAKNKRNNVYLTFEGESLHIADWARKLGLNRTVITQRIQRGWSIDKILTSIKFRKVLLSYKGKTQTQLAWAKELGIAQGLISQRYKKGWDITKILSKNKFNQK